MAAFSPTSSYRPEMESGMPEESENPQPEPEQGQQGSSFGDTKEQKDRGAGSEERMEPGSPHATFGGTTLNKRDDSDSRDDGSG